MKKILGLLTLTVLGILVATLVLALAYRAFRQHQANSNLRITAPNGIREEIFVPIGGIDQFLQIRGEDRNNPVLLVLHGGPGFSYVPFTSVFQHWEKHFTVVLWDQRGAGKTFGRNGKSGNGSLTIDRMARDGIEVAEFLRSHFQKPKITIFAHSWGSVIGLPMIKLHPELFDAYASSGQVVNMERNEVKSYELLRESLKTTGDQKALASLEELGPPPYADKDTWMKKGRLIVMNSPPPPDGRTLPNIFAAALFTPSYSLKDAYHLFAAFDFSITSLYGEMMSYDAAALGNKFDVPLFIFQGDSDLQAPTSIVEEYFPTIEAPHKELILLKGEGHTAVLSNPDLFLDLLLQHVRPRIPNPKN
ncbi:MAG TPA: alpha/beta hydrolase [Pyrinomonadaceae bacterium]|nr:alpha/beta hydrolase [Pyrinomonadaceae bacterium]